MRGVIDALRTLPLHLCFAPAEAVAAFDQVFHRQVMMNAVNEKDFPLFAFCSPAQLLWAVDEQIADEKDRQGQSQPTDYASFTQPASTSDCLCAWQP